MCPCLPLGVLLSGAPAQQVLETQVIFGFGEHTNFPMAAIMPCGDIRLSFSVGQHTVTERGMALRSEDGGETWTECPGPGGSNCAVLSETEVVASGYTPRPDPQDPRRTTLPVWRSTDGGRTFGDPEAAQITCPFPQQFHGHRSALLLSDGTLGLTVYGHKNGEDHYTSALLESPDRGQTFTLRSIIAYAPDVGTEGFCEPVVCRTASGSLLCAMRTGGPLYVTRSEDDGRTWSEPEQVAPFGVCPDLLLLEDGRLALSYGRPGCLLMLSDDEGRTWGEPLHVYDGVGCSYTTLLPAGGSKLWYYHSRSGFCGQENPDGFNRICRTLIDCGP